MNNKPIQRTDKISTSGNVDLSEINTQLSNKADKGVSYTKSESDGKYSTLTALNLKADKTALTSKADVSALPTKTSQLTNDSSFVTTTDLATKANTGVSYTKAESDGKYATITALNTKANTSAIPTKTSQLTNDSNFATVKTRNIITAHPNDNYTLTKTDEYETLSLQGNVLVGSAFSITGGNGISCSKAGVIKVSTKTTYDTVTAEGVKWGSALLGTVVVSANSVKANGRVTCVGSDVLVQVTAGQILYLKVQGLIGDVIKGGKEYTNITVEYID